MKQQQFYFYDDVKNVRKNFFITYKGAMFEGEKYLGTTENSFDVVSIFVWVKDEAKLQGFTKDDFHFLKSEILSNYPKADIGWKNPIEQLMKITLTIASSRFRRAFSYAVKLTRHTYT